MPKLFQNNHIFKHDWNKVALGCWCKYPNPLSPHVEEVEILSREVDPITGILHTKRLITCKTNFPSFLTKWFNADLCYIYEESEVNPKTKTMQLRAKNLTLANILEVTETCTYTVNPENNNWTTFTQQAEFNGCDFLSNYIKTSIEQLSLDRFKQNAHKGLEVMDLVCERIRIESGNVTKPIGLPTLLQNTTTSRQPISKI